MEDVAMRHITYFIIIYSFQLSFFRYALPAQQDLMKSD
jgi:hypothetical protein